MKATCLVVLFSAAVDDDEGRCARYLQVQRGGQSIGEHAQGNKVMIDEVDDPLIGISGCLHLGAKCALRIADLDDDRLLCRLRLLQGRLNVGVPEYTSAPHSFASP